MDSCLFLLPFPFVLLLHVFPVAFVFLHCCCFCFLHITRIPAALRPWPIAHCCHIAHLPYLRPFLGSEVGHRSGSLQARSVSPCQFRPKTHPATVLQGLPASRRSSPSRHLVNTRRRVAMTRLSVDLTCPQVSSTLRRVYALASPDSGSVTLLLYSSYFFVSCCVYVLFFCIFRFILLFFLLFVGLYLPAMMCLI
jgi:hypothetical protein